MNFAPDLIKAAENAIRESAAMDFHRKVEAVAKALQAERDRNADAIEALAKTIRSGEAA